MRVKIGRNKGVLRRVVWETGGAISGLSQMPFDYDNSWNEGGCLRGGSLA